MHGNTTFLSYFPIIILTVSITVLQTLKRKPKHTKISTVFIRLSFHETLIPPYSTFLTV